MVAIALSSSAATSAGEKCSVIRSHHLVGAQPLDVFRGEAELAQDLVGVLADVGRRRPHRRRRARERGGRALQARSEEHTSELQSRGHLVCRLLLEKKKSS